MYSARQKSSPLLSISTEVEEVVAGRKNTDCFLGVQFLYPGGGHMEAGILITFKTVL